MPIRNSEIPLFQRLISNLSLKYIINSVNSVGYKSEKNWIQILYSTLCGMKYKQIILGIMLLETQKLQIPWEQL